MVGGPLVVVLVGQSNMIRTGATVVRPALAADGRIAGTLRWWLRGAGPGLVAAPAGPGLALARALAAATGRAVTLVGGAAGGTTIAQWGRGGALYAETLGSARALVAAGGDLAAVVAGQGETDARSDVDGSAAGPLGALHPDDWHVHVGALAAALRCDLGRPRLPVVLSLLAHTTSAVHGNWTRVERSQAQVALCDYVPVEPEAAGPVDLVDGLHWTDADYGDQGRRLAAAYLALGRA